MSYSNMKMISSSTNGIHTYTTYELQYHHDKESFFKYFIPILKEEYGLGIDFEEKIGQIKTERTETIKRFLLKNLTPDPSINASNNKSWLKITRSKVAECLAKAILVELEKVFFTCRVSLEEEDPDMPKRGIDNFGFVFKDINGDTTLENIVACEVKTSDSKISPPKVVHNSKDSMYSSCKSFAEIDKRLQKAIAKSIDKLSKSQYLELICEIAVSIETADSLDSIKKKIMVVPFLLRNKVHYTDNDFGKFVTESQTFDKSKIKYFIIKIDYNLAEFGDEVYKALREGIYG